MGDDMRPCFTPEWQEKNCQFWLPIYRSSIEINTSKKRPYTFLN